MKISETSVKRPVAVLMVVLIIIIMGFVSLSRIPLDLMPQMEIPYALVSTTYSGVGPQEIEKLVTKPIEQAVSTAQNLKNVSSISSEGNSMVIIEFNYGIDMDQAALDLREKIDMIKGTLPEDASSPTVLKINMNSQPILTLSMSSSTMSLTELQKLAEDTVQPRLERAEGVASVSVTGGLEDIIEIRTSNEKLAGYGITLSYLQGILASENVNLPGGTVKKGSQELSVKTTGEFQTVEEIEQLLIPLPAGSTVHLSELADVALKPDEQTTISKSNGNPGISISIQKRSDGNTVQVSKASQAEIAKMQNEHELDGVEISVVQDSADYILSSLKSVAEHGIAGALMAVVILYLFLRNIRSTLIISTAIPISIIATFALMYFADITLNLMTLSGLMLAIGRLIDDSVVVLENIYRYRQNGYSRVEAAIKGSSEVMVAVLASTLTFCAVFLPFVFVEGMMVSMFKEFSLTIVFAMAASWVVAMTVVPMLSAKLLNVTRHSDELESGSQAEVGELQAEEDTKQLFRSPALLRKTLDKFDQGYQWLLETYKKILNWALSHRKRVIIATTIFVVLSMASIGVVGTELMPATDEGMITIGVSLSDGAEIEDTVAIMSKIETKIADIPEIDSVFADAGSGGMMSLSGAQGNVGNFTVKLFPLAERKRGVSEIADEIRNRVADVPGAEISISASQSMTTAGDPISITIKGDDLDELKKIGDDFVKVIKTVPGAREVQSSYEDGIPEVEISVDRKAASQYGLTASTIASAVRSVVSGVTATQYKYEGTEIDVKIKGDERFNQNIEALKQIPISTSYGYTVPLSEVADVEVTRGPVSINRDNQQRTITVSGQIIGRDIGSVSRDIQTALVDYQLPDKYSYEMGGQQEEMASSFSSLFMALGLAVIFVYMIMAAQFESLIQPLVIMFSIPTGFAGAFLGLLITGKPLSIMSIIGLIMLAGIVVSNAIVLVDYVNTRRRVHGESIRDAILYAGPIRLRPILMTTLTTALAMLPLSLGIGEGSEYQAPMGIVVIAGLLISTLVTLVLIPVMYSIAEDRRDKSKSKHQAEKKAVPSIAPNSENQTL